MPRRLAVAFLLLIAGAVLAVMFRRQLTDSMLFYPSRGQSRTPAALGLPYKEIWLDAEGLRVQAWWVAPEAPGPVLVMFHGNAGVIADRLENVAEMVSRLGVSVLQVEYPGYGDSEGSPSEQSLLATGEAALVSSRKLAGERPVVVFGRSLGGAVALHAAAKVQVEGVVIESTFTDLADMAASTGIPMARHLVAYRFDSLAAIQELRAALLVIHGDRDEIVPFEMGRRLYSSAAAARSKAFHVVAGGRHNDTWFVGGEPYWKAWTIFLRDSI